ncbi:MAG TPA: MBL fold metallo-hydrolase [Phycisphaerae bacterium]|nr:MBL fold metallo-hydrolase [Phycisphaerae bacterium]
MPHKIKVTVVVENTAGAMGLLGEHGLALWIETPDGRLLFDTGQGLALEHNAQRLEVPLARADAVVLSHGHYDHTGGLPALLKRLGPIGVCAHPDALIRRYSKPRDGEAREVHTPELDRAAIESRRLRFVPTSKPTEIIPGLWATGEIPRTTSFEDTGGPFFLDADGTRPDLLPDDQAVYFRSRTGTVVLLGCAHAGVVNTLRYVRQLTDAAPVHAVCGGMHLLRASPQRLEATCQALRELDVQVLGPSHCTGRQAVFTMWQQFPGRLVPFHAGARLEFDMFPAGGGSP